MTADDFEVEACWCGAEGENLFDDSGLVLPCGGTRVVNCVCGGDFCACHYHGEADCPGCPECDLLGDDEP